MTVKPYNFTICVDGLYEFQIYLFIYYILLRKLGWGVYSGRLVYPPL